MGFFRFLSPKQKKDPMTDLLEKQKQVTDKKREVARKIIEDMDNLTKDRRLSNGNDYHGPERRILHA